MALFPVSAPVHGAAIFLPAHLHANRQVSPYQGANAGHLSAEVQLAYIAATWFNDMTRYRFHPSFLASLFDAVLLLKASSGSGTEPGGVRIDWHRHAADDRQLDWILRAGLGPLLRWAASDGEGIPAHWARPLLAADLTARVRHTDLVATTVAVLDVCRDLRVEATLLKGISVGDRLYPLAHMRPMADVDVLVPADDEHRVAEELLAHGFERIPYPDTPGQNHGAPLRHTRRRTLVELHIALFPVSAPVHGAAIFLPAHLHANRQVSPYQGADAGHLSAEIQLAYIAAAWFNDMTTYRFHPSFLASLFDAVLLLKADGSTFDWDQLLRPIDNEMVKASLYALLTYVTRFGTTPPPGQVLRRLADNGGLVGPLQRRLIHAALDRYLLEARVWSLPFPPPMPGRYSPRHQFEKRILRR